MQVQLHNDEHIVGKLHRGQVGLGEAFRQVDNDVRKGGFEQTEHAAQRIGVDQAHVLQLDRTRQQV